MSKQLQEQLSTISSTKGFSRRLVSKEERKVSVMGSVSDMVRVLKDTSHHGVALIDVVSEHDLGVIEDTILGILEAAFDGAAERGFENGT